MEFFILHTTTRYMINQNFRNNNLECTYMWMEVVSEHIYGHIIDHVLVFVIFFYENILFTINYSFSGCTKLL